MGKRTRPRKKPKNRRMSPRKDLSATRVRDIRKERNKPPITE